MKKKDYFGSESNYKGIRVSNRELRKWCKILGVKKIILLYIEDKLELTQEQLDEIIKIKNRGKHIEVNHEEDKNNI